MKTPRPWQCAALVALLALPAFAQKEDDAPIPYDEVQEDEDAPRPVKKAKKKRKKTRSEEDVRSDDERLREEDEREKTVEEEQLARSDDPNLGLGFEAAAAVMLLEASRGGVDPRFLTGARVVWEFGRLMDDQVLREMFFVDFAWLWSASKDGTSQISVDSSHHFFTVAPAVGYAFDGLPILAYAQLGMGVNFTQETLLIANGTEITRTPISSVKPAIQYGVGFRFRPALTESQAVRLAIRVEITRFVRGYMHDMFFGGSVGLTF